MVTKKKKSPKWLDFEKRVGQIFTLSGYSVEHDCLIGGGQTDLFATNNIGPISTRMLVECKYSEVGNSVSINDVENFSSRIIVLRNQDLIDAGILVTNTRFTKNAKALVKNIYIELITIEELYLRIFDFRPYLLSFINNFEKSKLNEVYIKPKMANLSIVTESSTESESIDMLNYFSNWVTAKGGARVCLLGDYGAGKTSFCQKFAFELAKKHLKDPNKNPIPLLLPLHKYTKAINIKALITDFIVNDCSISNFRYDSFKFLLKSGRFFLLLDGFDEMARHVDKEVRYQTISELSKLAKNDSKVVLTGRPGYFPSHDELMQIIAGSKEDDLYQIARDAYDELVDYDPFEIQPFNFSQISEYVKLYIQNEKDANRILTYIKNTYNLIDLATRPVLLEMVVKSLPTLLTLAKETIINAAKLYEVYTNLWIDREEKKGAFRKLIRKIDKLRFMEELAYQLFVEDKNFVSYKQLNPRVCNYFSVDDCDLDYFAHDIRTCSFLFRIPRKGYMFIHRSFQEFFVAKKLESDLSKKDNSSWVQRLLPKEILRFLTELLIDIDKQDADILKEWSLDDPSSILGQNTLLTLLLIDTPPPDKIKKYYDLPGSILQSYAYLKLDGHAKSEKFITYLYGDLLGCNSQARHLNLKKNIDGLDIVHDAFYKTLSILKRQPLMQASKIISNFKYTIVSAQRDVEKSILRQQKNTISFSDLVEDLSLSGFQVDEDSLFGTVQRIDEQMGNKEIIRRIKKILSNDEYELLEDYSIEGMSIVNLTKKFKLNRNAIRSRLHRLRKKIVKDLKENGLSL